MAEMRTDIAADGTMIGSVNVAPNADEQHVAFAPAVFDEETGNVQRVEMTMSPDAVLDPNAKDFNREAVELVLPGYTDNGKKLKAIELYVTGEKSIVEIAKEIGVPERTVARWAEDGNWLQFNERMAETLRKHEKARITVKRVKEREKAIDEQIELGHKISAIGKEILETVESSGQFKAVAEGLKLGSDMVGRALAINESGKVDSEDKKDAAAEGARPLVMVFGNGGLPPMPVKTEVVDV